MTQDMRAAEQHKALALVNANSSFSRYAPWLQIAWDSTSLSALKRCPRYYELSIVQGWAPRQDAGHLAFGIWYHSAIEGYHRGKALGHFTHEQLVRYVIAWLMHVTWDQARGRPWTSDFPQKTRQTLVRSVLWYLDRFGETDPLATVILANGKPAVELSFRFASGYKAHSTGEEFLLCGHGDRLVELSGHRFMADLKTTKHALDDTYFEQYTPDNQVSLYTMAGKIFSEQPLRGVIIDAAQVLTEGTRFERRPIGRTPEQLEEWHRDLGFWLTAAQMFARQAHWPQNDKACFGCAFRPICSRPPSVRQEWLKASYVQRVWDPLKTRGGL